MRKRTQKININITPCCFLLVILFSFLFCIGYRIVPVYAEAGVIIQINLQEEPNPSILSLQEMIVDISIDNQHAQTRVLQIFKNHIDRILEGEYKFQLPSSAIISNFAVWDNGIRIPGVIMEKARAKALYKEITQKQIDPGLLHQADEKEERNVFVVKVAPIPVYGTKRLELEYTQNLPLTSMHSFLSFPLKPTMYREQSAKRIKIHLRIASQFPVGNFKEHSASMPLKFSVQTPYLIDGTFEAQNFDFIENFEFDYVANVDNIFLNFLTYRKTDLRNEPIPLFVKKIRRNDMDGYFYAAGLFNLGREHEQKNGSRNKIFRKQPLRVVILLDTSLSMHWEKLDKSYEAINYFLDNLNISDQFALILFNDKIKKFRKNFVYTTPQNIGMALQFIKANYLTNGTNLLDAFKEALKILPKSKTGRKQNKNYETYLIAITDGHPTLAEIGYKKLTKDISRLNTANVPIFIFGIGNDSNTLLLDELAKTSEGYFDWVKETDNIDFKLKTFFNTIGQKLIKGIHLALNEVVKPNRIYPADAGEIKSFNGSAVTYVGRYSNPKRDVSISINGEYEGKDISKKLSADFPEESLEHPHLKRLWAKARVDFLLKKIEFEGENNEWIDEIIELSKQYNFVTPYTAFLAAPRSLLRPRVIKPGDPVLRVKTDAAIVSVIALFPFNLTKILTYLKGEDVWETRFLAPVWMTDGQYDCTLILRDINGNIYREKKSFIIDSQSPTIKIVMDKKSYKPGEKVQIRVYSDQDTRRITARFLELPPLDIVWDSKQKACVGNMKLPRNIPGGSYSLQITAEDFAHNISNAKVNMELE